MNLSHIDKAQVESPIRHQVKSAKGGYPGNVRELRNGLERSLILESGPETTAASLLMGKARRAADNSLNGFFTVDQRSDGRLPSLAELQKLHIERLLAFTGGNRSETATAPPA